MSTAVEQSALSKYATYTKGPDFAWWCEEYLVQSIDQWAGEPLVLEGWQRAFFDEALALDEDELPFWKLVVLVVPRKNSKTTMLGGYALYQCEDAGQPEILLAASSDKQAGRLFDSAVSFVRRSRHLSNEFHLRQHVGEIARKDGGGKVIRMASDAKSSHGYNPSRFIGDELHAWMTPSLRRAWAAFTTAGGARKDTQSFAITTAGEAADREDSILGQLIDRNEQMGEVERPHAGLTISRNFRARTLVFNYSAPTRDPRDTAAMKLANPASWITEEYLAEQAENPALSDAEVLQLHGCVWANTGGEWVDVDRWRELEVDGPIPPGSSVTLGVDVALTGDTTAIAVAWHDGQRAVLEAEAWTAVKNVVADHYVDGGRIRLSAIEARVLEFAELYRVDMVVYDPRFFEGSAERLSDAGLTVMPLDQGSKLPEAAQEFWVGVRDGTVAHTGGKTLSAHVLATAAEKSDRGWKVRKVRQTKRIDACVAAIMAHMFCGQGGGGVEWG